MLYAGRTLIDTASGEPIPTMTSRCCAATVDLAAGRGRSRPPHLRPNRPPVRLFDIKARANSALISRRSGDRNPLYADRDAAAAGGLAPLLQRAVHLWRGAARHQRAAKAAIPRASRACRCTFFSAGLSGREAARTEMSPEGGEVGFRARALARNAFVLNTGMARVSA